MKIIKEPSKRYIAILPWLLFFINGKEVGKGLTISVGWLHWAVFFIFGTNKDYKKDQNATEGQPTTPSGKDIPMQD